MMKEALFGGSQEAMRVLTVIPAISTMCSTTLKKKKTDHGVRNDKFDKAILAIPKKTLIR